jgi:hypothetical protein
MGVVLRVKRGISTLAAFGCDDGVRQFGLAHLGNRAAATSCGRAERPNAKHRHRRRRPSGFRHARDRQEPDQIGRPKLIRPGASGEANSNTRANREPLRAPGRRSRAPAASIWHRDRQSRPMARPAIN